MKTGTVTTGEMSVAFYGTFGDYESAGDLSGISPESSDSKNERSLSVLRDAAAVEALSEHRLPARLPVSPANRACWRRALRRRT